MLSTLDHIIIAVEDLNHAEQNYKKIFGIDPVWRGICKNLGTANIIFNFKNTYCELLASNGSGLGAELVTNSIKESGEGVIGVGFGTDNIENSYSKLKKLLSLIHI